MGENFKEINFSEEKEFDMSAEGTVISSPFLGNIIVPLNILKCIGSALNEFFEFIPEEDFYYLTSEEIEKYGTKADPMITIAACLIQVYLAEMRRGIIKDRKVAFINNGKELDLGYPNAISFTPDSSGKGININANLYNLFVYLCVQRVVEMKLCERIKEYTEKAGEVSVKDRISEWVSIHFAQHIYLFPKGSEDETDYFGKSLMVSFKDMWWKYNGECAKIDCRCEFINYANFNPELKDSPVRKFFGIGNKQAYECVIHVEITDFIMIGKIKQ